MVLLSNVRGVRNNIFSNHGYLSHLHSLSQCHFWKIVAMLNQNKACFGAANQSALFQRSYATCVTRFVAKYFAIFNNENLPQSIKIRNNIFKNFAQNEINPPEKAQCHKLLTKFS